jgi:hypothetical protein
MRQGLTLTYQTLKPWGFRMKAYLLAGMIMLGLATAFIGVSFFSHTVQANVSTDN